MKYKIGLLREPVANPVNLMEIYRKVIQKEKQPEESIIAIPVKLKQRYRTTAKQRYLKYKVYHTKYDINRRLRKQIFKTMSNRLRCPRCNKDRKSNPENE